MAASLLLVTLAGCTGTEEESIPIILVVGSVEPAGPQLQLYEDVRDPMAAPARDLAPVGAPLRLPDAPVSLDVVDRNGERSELVVLDESGALHFVDISDLPVSFALLRSIDVAALIPSDPLNPALCWQQVQIGGGASEPGRYAALLESCPDEPPEVYVVDLVSQELEYALTQEHVGTQLLPIGIYVDQRSDLLYFAADEIGEVEVQSLPLTGAVEPEPLGETPVDPPEAVDLSPIAGGIGVLAEDGALGIVPYEGDPLAPADLGLSEASMLLPDPSSNVELLAAFSETRGRLVEGLDDIEFEELFLRRPLVDATLEPVQRFAYLLEEGGVEILDLFPYADPPSNRLLFFDLPGLDEPRVITWAFGTRLP
ncbi:MAG TPA: hypothetical protein VF168_09350 [Trueperaceae bacterium]